MRRFLAQRLVDSAITLLLVLTLVFVILRILPGDPAVAALGDMATPDQLAAFRTRMGIDAPIAEQFATFIWHMLRFDFGRSFVTNEPARAMLAANLPYTIELTIAAMLVGAVVGIPTGVVASTNRGAWTDYAARGLSLLGFCMPEFFLGALLLIIFALKLDLFPIMGGGAGFFDRLGHLVLPACTLGIVMAAFTTRLTRSAMLEVLGKQYIRTARAKGLARRAVIYKHALRNASMPIVTGFGLYILSMLSGSIPVELVFSRPGLGSVLVSAILARDYPVVQATLVLFAFFVVAVNLAMDAIYAATDPRVRLAG